MAYTLENPVFGVYLIAASLMVIKLMGQGWLTVFRMIRSDGGLMNPEDLLPGPFNRAPRPEQLAPSDYVERARRLHRNDLENIPAFLAVGLMYVATSPSLGMAQGLMYGFVAARVLHAAAYLTAQRHEVRAIFFTVGSVIVIWMAGSVLVAAAG